MEPYDVIVNQPVVIDNVSAWDEIDRHLEAIERKFFFSRMNHHQTAYKKNSCSLNVGTLGIRNNQGRICRGPDSKMHLSQLVSTIQITSERKCSYFLFDDITEFGFFSSVWGGRSTFEWWPERWKGISLSVNEQTITVGCLV
jgi:hypothetical protein